MIYAIIELKFIIKDEFIYRFPLCKNFEDIKKEINLIKQNRNFELDSYLKEKIKQKENYALALKYFLENSIDLDTLATIIFDRKSSKSTRIYLELYNKLLYFYQNRKQYL